jgi:hypothetical protein
MKLALFAAAMLLAAPALAGDDLEFKLTNASHANIKAFYVSHVGANTWENNLLAGAAVRSGQAAKVVIADGRSTCAYDIKAVFDDGSQTEDRNVDLCEMQGYTVSDAR